MKALASELVAVYNITLQWLDVKFRQVTTDLNI